MEEQLEKLKAKNPWTDLTEGKVKIARCDIPYFEKWAKRNRVEGSSYEEWVEAYANKKKDFLLNFNCLPDPYGGNPDSKVYCLNINPGEADLSFEGVEDYAEATKKNLRLESENCFWAEGIKNAKGEEHKGVGWTSSHIKDYLIEELGCPPDIFNIEYFPYHSKGEFYFPKHLPSYDFSDELIRQAMEDKKMIIILRGRRKWLERIPELAEYERLYVLLTNREIRLAPEYIVPYKPLSNEEIHRYFKLRK